jgi:hypothetical protein
MRYDVSMRVAARWAAVVYASGCSLSSETESGKDKRSSTQRSCSSESESGMGVIGARGCLTICEFELAEFF